MAHKFRTERRVEFAETDMAGIAHFANYFRYMEEAEHEFFRSLGLDIHSGDAENIWGFARGNASCEYKRPLRYADVFELEVIVRDKKRTSLRYEVNFYLDGENIAIGAMTVVCVAKGKDGKLSAVTMPEQVAAAIEVAPE